MWVAIVQIYIFLGLHFLNALEIPVFVSKSDDHQYLPSINIPQRIKSTEESGGENFLNLNQQDIDEINKLTSDGRVANSMESKYQYVLLQFKVLLTYMHTHKDRSIMLEWNHWDNKPRLYTMKRTDTALDKNAFRMPLVLARWQLT